MGYAQNPLELEIFEQSIELFSKSYVSRDFEATYVSIGEPNIKVFGKWNKDENIFIIPSIERQINDIEFEKIEFKAKEEVKELIKFTLKEKQPTIVSLTFLYSKPVTKQYKFCYFKNYDTYAKYKYDSDYWKIK